MHENHYKLLKVLLFQWTINLFASWSTSVPPPHYAPKPIHSLQLDCSVLSQFGGIGSYQFGEIS